MTSVESRAAGAIVGSFIADAATLPVHWVYNQELLASEVAKHATPEFIPNSICPFYQIPTGKNSAYGDHLYVLLKSVVENRGFNENAYKEGLKAMFGPGSAFDYERPSSGGPAQGPYLHGSMKKFLQNLAQNQENTGDTGSTDVSIFIFYCCFFQESHFR
nr:crystallin J1A-like [Lytechinus pictus]